MIEETNLISKLSEVQTMHNASSIFQETRLKYKPMNIAVLFLFMFIIILQSSCYYAGPPQRGDLPYYNCFPHYSLRKAPTLDDVYYYEDAAVLVSLVQGPRKFNEKMEVEPGSPEDMISKKMGVTYQRDYYEYIVKIEKILDDKGLGLKTGDEIYIKKSTNGDGGNDPFHIYIQDHPRQKFVIVLYYWETDDKKVIYGYTNFIQYYEKNGVLFSANEDQAFDQYSGMKIDEFASLLKKLKSADATTSIPASYETK